MWRELEERTKIYAHNTETDIFSAQYKDRYHYPLALRKADHDRLSGAKTIRNKAHQLWIDSAFDDESIGNRETLAFALECNADVVFHHDIQNDGPGTAALCKNFLDYWEDAKQKYPNIPVPAAILQEPYVKTYQRNKDLYDKFGIIAVGSLQTKPVDKQIQILRRVRDAVGPLQHLHAFGIGLSLDLIKALREYPGTLVNSMDMSTAEKSIFGTDPGLPDKTMKQKPTSSAESFDIPTGEAKSTVQAYYSLATLMMANYMLSPFPDDKILEEEYSRQAQLRQTKVQEAQMKAKRGDLSDPSPALDESEFLADSTVTDNEETNLTGTDRSNAKLSSF